MKKLFYIFTVALAGLTMWACQQEHVEMVFDPSKVTAQTLGDITGVELDKDGDKIVTTFSLADFGISTPVNYTLYASASEDMADKKKMTASISVAEKTISMLQKDINSMVFNLGGVADEPFTIYFQLVASLANDKNQGIAATAQESNVVAATFTAYSTIIKDVDIYDHVWVIGNSVNTGSWSHDKVYQYLYDYEKTGKDFSGLVDFGESHAENQFKLTGAAAWGDDTGNWGVADGEETDEPATIQLANGSNTNIWQYTQHRFYFFTFDNSSLVITKKYAFDNVGIVGAFNGWNAADADMKMTYNDKLHRFYIDQTFDDATELKFTCDDDWALNWGGKDGTTAGGGDNIAVEAGSYRIYLDLNKSEYSFDTAMYGKEEPTGDDTPEPGPGPEPEPVTGWNVIGLNGDWENDILATADGNIWTVYLNAPEATEFKWRKDGGWDLNYGGTFVALDEPFAAVAGGDNIQLAAGFWKVVLNTDALTITISEGNVWSLIGAFNEWSADVDMVLTEGKWVSPVTSISGEFKIRHNHDWTDNFGGTLETIGVPFAAIAGGSNIAVEAGSYIVTYDPDAATITVDELGWGLVGTINSWGGSPDIILKEDGLFLVAKNVALTADDEIKLRYNQSWDINRGGASVVGTPVKAVPGGDNIKPGVAGNYDVYYRPDCEVIIVTEAGAALEYWGVVGTINNWGAPDILLYQNADGELESAEITLVAADQIKIRKNEDWAVNRGGTFVELGQAFDVVADGANIVIGRDATIQVVYNAAAETITIKGQYDGDAPAFPDYIYAIGADTEWAGVYPMKGNLGAYKGFGYLSGEYKFRENEASWDGNNWGAGANIGQLYAGGDNIAGPTTPGYYMIEANLDALSFSLTLIESIGIIGPAQAGGWDSDTDLTYNAETGAWEATDVALSAGQMKFRANDSWDINWGGSLDALTQGGDNLEVEAGTYKVQLFAWCDGRAYAILTPAN